MKIFKFRQKETIELLILVAMLVNLCMAVNNYIDISSIDISSNTISVSSGNKQLADWIDNIPEGHITIGKTFSTNLDMDRVVEVAREYFNKNTVCEYRISCKSERHKLYSIEYIVEENGNRKLLEPLVKLMKEHE